jgi:hypothetical protein
MDFFGAYMDSAGDMESRGNMVSSIVILVQLFPRRLNNFLDAWMISLVVT